MLMKWTSPALFDQDGHLTNNAVKLFERRLQTSRKDGLNPNDNDLRVTGMLMKWTFESKDTTQYNAPTAVLPSFPRVKSFILERVPQLNNSVEESTPLRNLRVKTCSSWMDCLKKAHFDPDTMIDALIRKRKTIPTAFPKSHILFIGHLLDQLSMWGTLGGFDEQNIESAHAIWNQLMRQMGATRGKESKKKVFIQYYLKSAEFIQSNILRLKEESKRPYKYDPRRPKAEHVENDDSAVAEGQIDTVEVDDGSLVADINGEVALHQPLMVVDPSKAADDNGDSAVGNDAEETAQVKVSKEDTMDHTCSHCKKRLLGVALRVHMFEALNVTLCAEAESR